MAVFKASTQKLESIDKPCNGKGTITVSHCVPEQELSPYGKLLGKAVLAPSSEIGYHIHSCEMELYYILSGKGRYNDNGTVVTVEAGDTTITHSGQGHGLINLENSPLEFIAVILKEDA